MLEAIRSFVKGEPVALIGILTAAFAVAVLVVPDLDPEIEATVIGVATAVSAFLARAFVTPTNKL